ncbi:MAG: oxaloacetate decarboxylase subunit alpha, partial [Oscillospiraceae bacterium]|nr:oxaloacetate decarboxylase subunit alpha [Oscillospiraceae bacterium]
PVKQKYIDNKTLNPKSMATDAQALVYKVPGGMLSNMIANLTDMKAMDKFDAALAEIPAVRADMGYPPLVTPLSQMVGNQAVTNVLVGQRYKNISKEIKSYLKGEYGIAPAPVDAELQKRVLEEAGMDKPVDCRVEDKKRTGEEFKAARKELGDLARCDEDVMSYICFPDQARKFLEGRKAREENIATYTITEG